MKQGDKVKVSDYSIIEMSEEAKFLMMNPIESEYKYLTYNKIREVQSWKYCELVEQYKNGWYTHNEGDNWMMYYDFESFKIHGISSFRSWHTHQFKDLEDLILDFKNTRLATDEEIKTALIAEAKKRGFKEGVYAQSVYDDEYSGIINTDPFIFQNGELWATSKGYDIQLFEKGIWAEMIDQKSDVQKQVDKLQKEIDELKKLIN